MTTIVSDLVKKSKLLKSNGIAPLTKKDSICSHNMKTGWSLNFPIWQTCLPTAVCSRICYAAMKGKPITWPASLQKQLKVLDYFKTETPEVIADRIRREYMRRKMSFLRINGVGDLFEESVQVINILTNEYPGMVLWVVTRIPEFAAQLSRTAPNLYINFSLDSSMESKKRKKSMDCYEHPRLYYSFLRLNVDEDTMGARIVFNAQQKKKGNLLPFDDPKTVCPVDAGLVKTLDACVNCKKCFSSEILDGAQHQRRLHE